MRMISGIKITGNSKLKINYNKRTQIKAGRKIVKKMHTSQNEDDNEYDTYQ